jgi:hypothetical protein
MEMFTWPHKAPSDFKRDTVLRIGLGLEFWLRLVSSAFSAGAMPTGLGYVSLGWDMHRALSRRTGR